MEASGRLEKYPNVLFIALSEARMLFAAACHALRPLIAVHDGGVLQFCEKPYAHKTRVRKRLTKVFIPRPYLETIPSDRIY